MLADLYAASVSNPGFNWICSPACTELEQVVIDWMAGVLGLDKAFWMGSGQGGGIILVSQVLVGESADVAVVVAMFVSVAVITGFRCGPCVQVALRKTRGLKGQGGGEG
jgi:hypothetical protein